MVRPNRPNRDVFDSLPERDLFNHGSGGEVDCHQRSRLQPHECHVGYNYDRLCDTAKIDLECDLRGWWIADIHDGESRAAIRDHDQVVFTSYRHRVPWCVYLRHDQRTRRGRHVEYRDPAAGIGDRGHVGPGADVDRVTRGVYRRNDARDRRRAVQWVSPLLDLRTVPNSIPVRVHVGGVGAHDQLALVVEAVAVAIPGRRWVQQDRRQAECLAGAKRGELVKANS